MYKKYASILFIIFTMSTYCVDIGSDTAVTRFNNQVTVNNGDRIAAFAALNGGFKLANSAVVAEFDSFFGVSGTVDFTGGTLGLAKDLILQDVSSLISTGTAKIHGNLHQIEVAPALEIMSSNFLFTNLQLILNNDLTIRDSQITFTGTCVFDGNSGHLTLEGSTVIIVGAGSQLTLRDITIRKVNGSKIRNTDNTGKIVFDNVHLILDSNYSFTRGSFDVHNTLILDGDGFAFNYQVDLQSTITSNSQLILQNGVTFNYAPTIASKTLLQLLDATSSLMINGATFATTTTAIQLTKGNLFIEGKSFLSNAGTVAAQAIEFGDGANAANNLTVEWLPAAKLELVQGFLRNRNV